MIKKIGYRFIGLLLLLFCGSTWAWMLGVLALPPSSLLTGNHAKLMTPDVLAMELNVSVTAAFIVSVIATFVGFLFVFGVIPLGQTDELDDNSAHRTPILMSGVFTFVLLAWGGAWAFKVLYGYPLKWYWLPIVVTVSVIGLIAHAFFKHASKDKEFV